MYTRYVRNSYASREIVVRFYFGDRLVDIQYVKPGHTAIYQGPVFPQIKGWSRTKGGKAEKLGKVTKSTNYYAVLDETQIGITLAEVKYILDGNLPTRNYRWYFQTDVKPEQVYEDQTSGLYFADVSIPNLKGTEWVRVDGGEMDYEATCEHFYCSPIRKKITDGLCTIQMVMKPSRMLNLIFSIDEYSEIEDVQEEATDMTKEELRELFGGVLPTSNQVIQESHTVYDRDFVENEYTINLPDFEEGDFLDLDTADSISKEEHLNWRSAGITIKETNAGSVTLQANGVINDGAVFHFSTRITKQKEV